MNRNKLITIALGAFIHAQEIRSVIATPALPATNYREERPATVTITHGDGRVHTEGYNTYEDAAANAKRIHDEVDKILQPPSDSRPAPVEPGAVKPE